MLILESQLWQAFVGMKARRVETYYQDLLALGTKSGNNAECKNIVPKGNGSCVDPSIDTVCLPEKWRGQIEKVIEHATYQFLFQYRLHEGRLKRSLNIHFGFNLVLHLSCRIYHEHFLDILL